MVMLFLLESFSHFSISSILLVYYIKSSNFDDIAIMTKKILFTIDGTKWIEIFTSLIHFQLKKLPHTAQKLKFSVKGFFSKCGKTHIFLRICSHLINDKPKTENFIFYTMTV